MEESWEKFSPYFEKVEKVISGLYRNEKIDLKHQMTQNEYLECNR